MKITFIYSILFNLLAHITEIHYFMKNFTTCYFITWQTETYNSQHSLSQLCPISFLKTQTPGSSHRNLAVLFRWLCFSAKSPTDKYQTAFSTFRGIYISEQQQKWLKQAAQHATPAMPSVLRLRKPSCLRFSWNICVSLFYRSGFQIKETDFQRQTLFWQPFLAKYQNNPVSWPASGSSIFTN